MITSQLLLVYCALAGTTTGQDIPRMPTRVPPAATLDVSGNLINAVVERPVETTEPVRDIILDAHIFGTAHTRSKVSVRLGADPNRAFLVIVLAGTSHSDIIGYNDPIKAYSHAIVDFEVHQPISLDARGVRVYPVLGSSKACVQLLHSTNFKDSDDTPLTGIGRYAFKEDRSQIEMITAQHAECRIKSSFTRELRPQIDKAGRNLRDALNVLADLGIPMQPLHWSSTATHLHGEAGLVVTAPMTAPPDLPRSADLAMRLHQSVLGRMAQLNLAGKSYSALDLLGLREKILNIINSDPKVPGAGVEPDKLGELLKKFGLDPVAITFAKTAPVEIDINADGFTITLRGSSFRQGDSTYSARNIRARYRIETLPGEIALARQGPVQIVTVGPNPELDDAKNKKVQLMLERDFDFFLPSRLLLPRITIPGERPIVLLPTHATTSTGWLTLSWTRSDKGVR